MSWIDHWNNHGYVKNKLEHFKIIDEYLKTPPISILEIGCGYAFESIHFQQKYGTELFLLDGEASSTEDNPRYGKFGPVEDFSFYNNIEDLKKFWNENNLNYTFVDANNINIPNEKKFDVIYSFKSCGFHYPIDTYYDLIKKHSDKNTKLIFDIRNKVGLYSNNFEIVETIAKYKPRTTYSLRLK